ncbi:MAG: DUF2089 domain-containing protein [Firmicutes bacterium]|nr:DUF2089 domain-containing protein [Bacillota bacterium]MDD4337027.1 DUF2089 domain-containing protein [Bacillota bacterium]MDD4791942.1 DUF2089 domain-containing protein [Bacillota bacterium]
MARREALGRCPVCGEILDVTRLTCRNCETVIEGRFNTCKFCQLNAEQKNFVEVFIKNRGNIKEVEKELGISYPTVRNRLDAVIGALGYAVDSSEDDAAEAAARRKEIIESLAKGEIAVDDAVRQLKGK